MMEKILIGLGGLAVGLVIGALALGSVFGDTSSETVTKEKSGDVPTLGGKIISQSDLDHLESLNKDAHEKAEKYRQERDKSEKQNATMALESSAKDSAYAKARKDLEEVELKLAAAIKEKADLIAANPNLVTPEQRAEQIAVARAKGTVIRDKIKSMMEAGEGKEPLLKSLRELIEIGTDAAPEYWEAFALISAKGNAFGGNNELGLNWMESAGLMPPAFADYTLGAGAKDAPKEAFAWAMYGLAYNATKTPEEKVKILGEILMTGDKQYAQDAVNTLGTAMTPLAAPYLAKAAVNGALEGSVRASAVTSMAQYPETADWTTIEQLQNDPDPLVSQAARTSMSTRNPQATGMMVTQIDQSGAAYRAGMRMGDIITRYNGQEVTDQTTLIQARNAAGENLEVTVIVQRGSQELSLRLPTGPLGISNGRSVTKK